MKSKRVLILLIVALLSLTAAASAQEEALKQRFLDRKPLLDTLKGQGLVGENNLGKLEARGTLNPQQQQSVDAENADRETVYLGISKQVGSTPLDVETEAAKIAEVASRPLVTTPRRALVPKIEEGSLSELREVGER